MTSVASLSAAAFNFCSYFICFADLRHAASTDEMSKNWIARLVAKARRDFFAKPRLTKAYAARWLLATQIFNTLGYQAHHTSQKIA